MNNMEDVGPLELTVGRWLVDKDEDAVLRFEASPAVQSVEMEVRWGDGPRQMRVYSATEADMLKLHEWLTRALGLET